MLWGIHTLDKLAIVSEALNCEIQTFKIFELDFEVAS